MHKGRVLAWEHLLTTCVPKRKEKNDSFLCLRILFFLVWSLTVQFEIWQRYKNDLLILFYQMEW